jgi:hypothetical protein
LRPARVFARPFADQKAVSRPADYSIAETVNCISARST